MSDDIIKKDERKTAVALKSFDDKKGVFRVPKVTAAGYGKLAEEILQLAFDNGVKVRKDGDLAHILAKMELESEIPSEALVAVAEILSYVYKVNGHLKAEKQKDIEGSGDDKGRDSDSY